MNKKEIDKAQQIIELLHPQRDRSFKQVLAPVAQFYFSKTNHKKWQSSLIRKNSLLDIRSTMAHTQNNDIGSSSSSSCFDDSILSQSSVSEERVGQRESDPLETFGLGIYSYFSLMQTLVFLFFLFTLCWVPMMFVFSNYSN